MIKRYVEVGLGVSIVTSICLGEKEKNLATIALNDYFPKRSYGVVVRRGKFLSPQAKLFLEIMDPRFFKSLGTKSGPNLESRGIDIDKLLVMP